MSNNKLPVKYIMCFYMTGCCRDIKDYDGEDYPVMNVPALQPSEIGRLQRVYYKKYSHTNVTVGPKYANANIF